MSTAGLEPYLAFSEHRHEALVRELDRLIMAAGPDLVGRLSYRMLMYCLGTDKRHWVVAVDARPKGVGVRFLDGVLLTAPPGVLRGGTATLMTLDLAGIDALDRGLVTDLVRQAVARYPDVKAGAGRETRQPDAPESSR